jgi:hypothetical protein
MVGKAYDTMKRGQPQPEPWCNSCIHVLDAFRKREVVSRRESVLNRMRVARQYHPDSVVVCYLLAFVYYLLPNKDAARQEVAHFEKLAAGNEELSAIAAGFKSDIERMGEAPTSPGTMPT